MFYFLILAAIQLLFMIGFSVFMKVCIECADIELKVFAKTGKFPKYAHPFLLKLGNIYYEYGKSSDSTIMLYNFFWPFLLVHYIIIALYLLIMREPKVEQKETVTGGCAAPRYCGANPETSIIEDDEIRYTPRKGGPLQELEDRLDKIEDESNVYDRDAKGKFLNDPNYKK